MHMESTLTGPAIAERLADLGQLDRPADFVNGASKRWRGRVADQLRGRSLGHALHPALTDLPIGFWTSAVVLDVVGGRKRADAAKRLVGLGVLSAVPTALAGFADVPTLEPAKRRVAVVHAASNTIALFLFTKSWWARVRGRRGAGIVDGLLASAVATFGGYLGGWLVFGSTPPDAGDTSETTGTESVSRLAAVR
jgi:uncharacterized membrane protein